MYSLQSFIGSTKKHIFPTMAQVVSRACVRFVVDKVALGEISLFSPVSIIPPWFFMLIYNLGDEK